MMTCMIRRALNRVRMVQVRRETDQREADRRDCVGKESNMSPAARVTQSRRRAYYYIKYTLSLPPWRVPIEATDVKLVETLGSSTLLESVISLADGKSNPSKQLVSAFRNLVRGKVSDRDIDSHLVAPFKT